MLQQLRNPIQVEAHSTRFLSALHLDGVAEAGRKVLECRCGVSLLESHGSLRKVGSVLGGNVPRSLGVICAGAGAMPLTLEFVFKPIGVAALIDCHGRPLPLRCDGLSWLDII